MLMACYSNHDLSSGHFVFFSDGNLNSGLFDRQSGLIMVSSGSNVGEVPPRLDYDYVLIAY